MLPGVFTRRDGYLIFPYRSGAGIEPSDDGTPVAGVPDVSICISGHVVYAGVESRQLIFRNDDAGRKTFCPRKRLHWWKFGLRSSNASEKLQEDVSVFFGRSKSDRHLTVRAG